MNVVFIYWLVRLSSHNYLFFLCVLRDWSDQFGSQLVLYLNWLVWESSPAATDMFLIVFYLICRSTQHRQISTSKVFYTLSDSYRHPPKQPLILHLRRSKEAKSNFQQDRILYYFDWLVSAYRHPSHQLFIWFGLILHLSLSQVAPQNLQRQNFHTITDSYRHPFQQLCKQLLVWLYIQPEEK